MGTSADMAIAATFQKASIFTHLLELRRAAAFPLLLALQYTCFSPSSFTSPLDTQRTSSKRTSPVIPLPDMENRSRSFNHEDGF